MKYLLSICCFLFCVQFSYTQELEKLRRFTSESTSISFSKGDTLQLGYPGKNAFQKKQKYFSVFVKNAKNICGFSELDTVLFGTYFVVKNMVKYGEHCSFEFANNTVAEMVSFNGETIFVVLEKALQSKELVIFPNPLPLNKLRMLDDKTVFLMTLGTSTPSADVALKYCRLADPEKAKVYESNLALFENDKDSWVKKLDEARKKSGIKDTFWIEVPAFISSFSNDKNEFKVVDSPGAFGTKPVGVNIDTRINFENFTAFSTLSSTKNKASLYINTTTADYNKNRKATLLVKAVCTSVLKVKNNGPTGELNTLNFTVLATYAFDAEQLKYNFIGSKK